MNASVADSVRAAVKRHGTDRTALLNILRDIQADGGCVPPEAIAQVAEALDLPRVEVAGVVSFYAFLSEEPTSPIVIRVCNDVVDRMKGYNRVIEALQQALEIGVGETTEDGTITLTTTACIGLSDQAPAALVNDVPVTELGTDKSWQLVRELRVHGDPAKLVHQLGDSNNAHPLVHSMVKNNIQHRGPLVFSKVRRAEALKKAVAVSPREVIRAVKAARLRGRGGAGFPTGMKWEFARGAPGSRKYVFCNADEGEPGTFSDRVILTERPDRVFAGMTIAGYAIGASEGVLYLRAEYEYLAAFLEDVLTRRRNEGLLGTDVAGKEGFHFSIRIQLGAGAYVCGEESALINSCEGRRGDPRNRPPFPAQRGFLDSPTVVNNVETLACVAKILEEGSASFAQYGTRASTGTQVLSVSGDCWKPGIYEVEFGTTLGALLEMVGASDTQAVQVGGPSGRMVGPDAFGRRICFDDLATGGSVVVFGAHRNLIEVARANQAFFAEESCGYCTPCRAGNELLLRYFQRIADGKGEPQDLEEMRRIANTMKTTSRCGLGQTACNPVLTTMESFPDVFEDAVSSDPDGFRRSFDLDEAVALHRSIRGDTVVEDLPDWAD